MANARRFRFDGEERFHRAFSAFESALEEARASGDYTQAQFYLDKASSIQKECTDHEYALLGAYYGSGLDERLLAEFTEIRELNEEMRRILRRLGGKPIPEEERDSAHGKGA